MPRGRVLGRRTIAFIWTQCNVLSVSGSDIPGRPGSRRKKAYLSRLRVEHPTRATSSALLQRNHTGLPRHLNIADRHHPHRESLDHPPPSARCLAQVHRLLLTAPHRHSNFFLPRPARVRLVRRAWLHYYHSRHVQACRLYRRCCMGHGSTTLHASAVTLCDAAE